MFKLLTATFLSFVSLASAQTFGIAITESSTIDYESDVNQAIEAGATATSLTLFWDEAMKDGRYAPDFDWPRIVNSYFPSKNLGLVLSLAVIDTDLVAISIGNEVDGVFTTTQDWEEFASFFKAASGTIFINYYRLVSSFHVLPPEDISPSLMA